MCGQVGNFKFEISTFEIYTREKSRAQGPPTGCARCVALRRGPRGPGPGFAYIFTTIYLYPATVPRKRKLSQAPPKADEAASRGSTTIVYSVLSLLRARGRRAAQYSFHTCSQSHTHKIVTSHHSAALANLWPKTSRDSHRWSLDVFAFFARSTRSSTCEGVALTLRSRLGGDLGRGEAASGGDLDPGEERE